MSNQEMDKTTEDCMVMSIVPNGGINRIHLNSRFGVKKLEIRLKSFRINIQQKRI